MADKTGIEWADSTLNPWIGCTKVSPACDHCYAEATDARGIFGGSHWGAGVSRKRTSAANWRKPLKWNAKRFMECGECGWRGERDAELIGCGACGSSSSMNDTRRRVFCASLADWLDNEVRIEWFVDLLDLIRRTPDLDWLLLTKRIGNWRKRILEAISFKGGISLELADWLGAWLDGTPPSNVWLGSTICNQAEADRDIPKLLALPTAVRFLSVEPLLGPVDLTGHLWGRAVPCAECPKDADCGCGMSARGEMSDEPALHWVIVGGESGPKARPMHPDWVRSLRDQCAAAGMPFLFKQWGEWAPGENVEKRSGVVPSATWFGGKWLMGIEDLACEDGHIDDQPDVYRVGKKAAGRLLDGVEHNGYPEASP